MILFVLLSLPFVAFAAWILYDGVRITVREIQAERKGMNAAQALKHIYGVDVATMSDELIRENLRRLNG